MGTGLGLRLRDVIGEELKEREGELGRELLDEEEEEEKD